MNGKVRIAPLPPTPYAPGIVQLRVHDIPSNGLRLRCFRWGIDAEGKPPLILSHATGFCGMVWRALAEPLADTYDVYALDRRGHGRSDKPLKGYAFRQHAQDWLGVLGHFGLHDVYAVGHSAGATDLLLAAATAPDRIGRLLVIEPIVPAPTTRVDDPPELAGAPSMAARARHRREMFPTRAALMMRWSRRAPFNTWDPEVFNDYVQFGLSAEADGSLRLLCPPNIEAQMYEQPLDHDFPQALTRIRGPVLLASGAASSANFHAMAAHAAALIPQARRRMIPEGTHFLPMEQPHAMVDMITEFGTDG